LQSILSNVCSTLHIRQGVVALRDGDVFRCQATERAQCLGQTYPLAALAAGNFGAVSTMAQMIGEKDFSLLFHKGEHECIHFSKVESDFLLVTIFDQKISLGFLRLKVAESITKIEKILGS